MLCISCVISTLSGYVGPTFVFFFASLLNMLYLPKFFLRSFSSGFWLAKEHLLAASSDELTEILLKFKTICMLSLYLKDVLIDIKSSAYSLFLWVSLS